VEEAARLLMGYNEVREGESRPMAQERTEVTRSNCGRGWQGKAGAAKGKAAVDLRGRGLQQAAAPQARSAARAAARAPATGSSGTPEAAAAAISSWGGLGTTEPAGISQGGLHIGPPAPTLERNVFLPNDSSESDGDDLAEGSDGDGYPENVRFAYRGSTWSKNHQTCNPEPIAFEDESYGLMGGIYRDPFLYSLV
jgi:hypothetical protein